MGNGRERFMVCKMTDGMAWFAYEPDRLSWRNDPMGSISSFALFEHGLGVFGSELPYLRSRLYESLSVLLHILGGCFIIHVAGFRGAQAGI